MQLKSKNKITRYSLLVTGYHECGQTIIEVIVAVAVFAVLSTSALFLILGSFESVRYGGEQEMALAFAQEGIDAVRSIANQGWGKLPFGGPYGVSSASGYWQISGTGDTQGKFSRTINVDQVYRDGGGNIVPSGTLDPRTKKVTSQVSWETVVGRLNLISLISYFSLWGSLIWQETTTADFSDGTFTDTQVANIGDGAVTLAGAAGPGFACIAPTAVYDTPSSVADGQDVFVSGTVGYLVTNNDAGASELYILNLTNQKEPTLYGSLNLNAGGNGIVVAGGPGGNYAYIASEDNNQELKVVNVTNPAAPTQVGSYNAPGTSDGLEIAVSGNYAYLVTANNATDSEFYILNILNPASPTLVSSLNIGETVNSIQISGNYAYLATGLNNGELVIVDITNPLLPQIVTTFDLPSNSDGKDLYLLGSYLYFVTDSAPGSEFYIIDVTNPLSPAIIGSLDIGGAPLSVVAYGSNAFVGTNIANKEIVVVDVTVPNNPQILSWTDAPGADVNGLYYTNDTLYAASAYNYAEFQIYEYEKEVSWRCHRQAGIYDSSSVSDGRDVFVVGDTAYLVTDNNTAGSELYILNVSNPANPTLLGSLNLDAAANGIFVSGNYAYIASSHNSQELQIVNVSNPAAPTLIGVYNAPTGSDATDVWVSGNFAYLTTVNSINRELYKINVANPASPSLVASVEIGGNVYGIHISGNYAYLATALNNQEMVVLDLTPTTPIIVGSYNAPSNSDGKDVFVHGTIAYLVTDPTADTEFYVLDVATPSSPKLLGRASWGSAGTTYAVFENEGIVFVGTSEAGSAVKIFDASNPAAPNLISVVTLVGDGALGLYYLNDYLYVASANNNAEFQIYERITGGGGGGGGYATSGYYISSIFDAGSGASWDYIFWTETLPAGCDIQVQIRTAATVGEIPTAEWSGPEGKDGDETDWFTEASGEAIHPDHEGDRFIQYRIYFTGPGTDTGVLEDISVEYEI